MFPSPLNRAGIVLGLGLGGFFDGIVLHQILGWHHLICTTSHCQPTSIEHLKRQNFQDGLFHLALWFVTIVGIALLYRARREPRDRFDGKKLFGSVLGGWGVFNFVEGLIDHQILGIHHVLPGHPNQLLYDLIFLASGVVLALCGWWLARPNRSVHGLESFGQPQP